jgi:hypothetical protein
MAARNVFTALETPRKIASPQLVTVVTGMVGHLLWADGGTLCL